MANQQHLEYLVQDISKWNTWRQLNPTIQPDLRNVDLTNAILIGADLRRADFSRAVLTIANLARADLTDADLQEADLGGVDLSGANLSRAYLRRANLRKALLRRADLGGAILRRADLREADLSGANLNGADLGGADLSDADLSRADLSKVNLRHAHLRGNNLKNAKLFRAECGWTALNDLNLKTVEGLETVEHYGPSTIGIDTILRSDGDIPDVFLRRAGVSDLFIDYIAALSHKPIEYYTCFICYASLDQDFAQRLYADLQSRGVRCWFAPDDLKIGDNYRKHIEESIRIYDKLLLILSEHSIASDWVAHEVEKALQKEPEGVPNVLFPIRVDKAILTCETTWAKEILTSRYIGDFEHWQEYGAYQKSFSHLLHSLEQAKL